MRRVKLALGVGTTALLLLRCAEFSVDDAPVLVDAAPDDGASESSAAPPDAADGASHCSAELETDPKNCGRCGHDCLGGECAAGECRPFVVAAGLTNPREIALTASGVYWEVGALGPHNLVGCPRTGCGAGPELLLGGLDDVRSLLVVGDLMMFVTHDATSASNRIEECTIGACTATRRVVEGPVSNTFPAFTPLRRGASLAYWASLVTTSGEVHALPLDGGGLPTTIIRSTGCSPRRVVPGPSDVTWTCAGSSEIRRCAIPCGVDGGVSLEPAGGAIVDHLDRTTGHLLWDRDDGALVIRNDETGSSRALTARGLGPLAVVGTDLIFQDGLRGQLVVCALPACVSIKPIATTNADGLAADEDAVFWTVPSAGAVMAVAR